MSQLEILASFAADVRPQTAADIVARTGLPRSTVFRALKILSSTGFVYREPKSKYYVLGPKVLQLGMIARRQLSAEDFLAAPLLNLLKRTGETVTFSIADVPSRLCVYALEGPSDLRQVVQAGTRYPLHLGAAGKVILAHLPAAVIAGVLENEPLSKAQSLQITKGLVRIREAGYAITTGERVPGAMGIGAPVFVGGTVFGSVAAVGPTERMEPIVGRQTKFVLEAARILSDLLTTARAAPNPDDAPRPKRRVTGKRVTHRRKVALAPARGR